MENKQITVTFDEFLILDSLVEKSIKELFDKIESIREEKSLVLSCESVEKLDRIYEDELNEKYDRLKTLISIYRHLNPNSTYFDDFLVPTKGRK